jgi:hypothetical protein
MRKAFRRNSRWLWAAPQKNFIRPAGLKRENQLPRRQKMKRHVFGMGLALVLLCGFILTGCPNGTGDEDNSSTTVTFVSGAAVSGASGTIPLTATILDFEDGSESLGEVGSISDGKLTLTLPASPENEDLFYVTFDKRLFLRKSSPALTHLFLVYDKEKQGWGFYDYDAEKGFTSMEDAAAAGYAWTYDTYTDSGVAAGSNPLTGTWNNGKAGENKEVLTIDNVKIRFARGGGAMESTYYLYKFKNDPASGTTGTIITTQVGYGSLYFPPEEDTYELTGGNTTLNLNIFGSSKDRTYTKQ